MFFHLAFKEVDKHPPDTPPTLLLRDMENQSLHIHTRFRGNGGWNSFHVVPRNNHQPTFLKWISQKNYLHHEEMFFFVFFIPTVCAILIDVTIFVLVMFSID
jgi:hypothetical protein